MFVSDKTEPVGAWTPERLCHKDGTCARCGECCATPVLNVCKEELDAIHAYIKANGITRQDHTRGIERDGDLVDLVCPFLTMDGIENDRAVGGSCSIYDARPSICRIYSCAFANEAIPDKYLKDKDLVAKLTAPQVNMAHEFFPETIPKESDMVCINTAQPALHDRYCGQPLIVVDARSDVAILMDRHTNILKDVPIKALTKLERRTAPHGTDNETVKTT